MGAKLTFNETMAFQLYHELKSDLEIAKTIGKSPSTIHSWRKRNNLPSISIDHRREDTWQTHRDYRTVLSPEQSKQMNTFLRALSWAGRIAVEAGVKPDVKEFINAYSGRTKSEEEKRIDHMWVQREIKKKSKEKVG